MRYTKPAFSALLLCTFLMLSACGSGQLSSPDSHPKDKLPIQESSPRR
jgi:hypothetical protein